MDEGNPVVMLCHKVWHIVESGRVSQVALCGRELRERRAHSRLRTVGRENVCPACLGPFKHPGVDRALTVTLPVKSVKSVGFCPGGGLK